MCDMCMNNYSLLCTFIRRCWTLDLQAGKTVNKEYQYIIYDEYLFDCLTTHSLSVGLCYVTLVMGTFQDRSMRDISNMSTSRDS